MWKILTIALLPAATSLNVAASPTKCVARGGDPQMLVNIAPTKAQRVVRQRLNPNANIDNMDEKQVRKYAYAMQIELQRMIREEQAAHALRGKILGLLEEQVQEEQQELTLTELTPEEEVALIPAMKMEGLERYGLPYATAKTSWDAVRANHPELASRSDSELFAAYRASGMGHSTFGELF